VEEAANHTFSFGSSTQEAAKTHSVAVKGFSSSPSSSFGTTSICTYDKCKQVHVLAECNVTGMHRDSFDVSQESEQAKLQRFLYFLKGT
jgi:hypothetical protein